MFMPLHRSLASLALALLLVLAPRATAQASHPFTVGIDVCNNVGVAPIRPQLARYSLATGEVDLPLVFAPGLGWYRAWLDPAGPGLFRLRSAVPSCEMHPSPATYLADRGEVLIAEIEAIDASGAVAGKYEATLTFDPARGLFVTSRVWPFAVDPSAPLAAPAAAPRLRALADETVQAVLLAGAVGPYVAGDSIPLSRITGGRIGAPEAGCDKSHLHGTIRIDGSGPYADPLPGACGFGIIVAVNPNLATSVVNVVVPAGTEYCGPDVTQAFFARLRTMSQRLATLPNSEKGMIDGALFLARNGGNMDFEVGAIRDPRGDKVCPTPNCAGIGSTSTLTLCGRCIVSHVDNDIEYGFVAQALGVPKSIQIFGAHGWDLVQRRTLDPLASQAAYGVGNSLSALFASHPNVSNADACAVLSAVRLRTGVLTWTPATDLFATEMKQFGKESCRPCPYGCPEALITKDFATQSWELDNGARLPYTQR